ncbi:MAG: CHAT domain-containing tetratricopeptide repeat protein [Cyanobacteria bacterium P01_F01_bin.150]
MNEHPQSRNAITDFFSIVRLVSPHLLAILMLGIQVGTSIGLVDTAHAITNSQEPSLVTSPPPGALLQEGLDAYRNSNPRRAIALWQQALPLFQSQNDRHNTAFTLANLGIAHGDVGNYLQAINANQQALAVLKQVGTQQQVGQLLGNLGNVYEAIGDYDQAVLTYQESLSIARAEGDRVGEGVVLGNLGAVYSTQGNYDQALTAHQQSWTLAKGLGDREGEGHRLLNLGATYHAQGDIDRAAAYYERSLAIAREVGHRLMESKALSSLGLVAEDLGNYDQAIAYHQDSLAIAHQLEDPRSVAQGFNNLGHALFNAGRLAEAEAQLRTAIAALEILRSSDLPDLYRVSLLDTQVLTFNLLQQILVAQGDVETALEMAERGRSRAFMQLVAQRQEDQTQDGSADRSTESMAAPPTVADIRNIAKETNSTLVEYTLVPDDEFKVQGKQRGQVGKIFIWVVQPSGDIHFRQVVLGQNDPSTSRSANVNSLEALIKQSRHVIPSMAERGYRPLHQWLIAPIADLLPSQPEAPVVFMPQEELHMLSFAALQDSEGQFLIEKHTMLMAPSIQILGVVNARDRDKPSLSMEHSLQALNPALIVGNPTMPKVALSASVPAARLPPLASAEEEANAIAQMINATAMVGDQATEAAIAQQMPDARLIHLATHGLLDYGNPRQSAVRDMPGAIALAPSMPSTPNVAKEQQETDNDDLDQTTDGLLTSGEIMAMELQAEMVVLSACNTGRGDITGDGVIGLARSFIGAGASNVVVSLWAVPDEPTSQLMMAFYTELLNNPNRAQALRQAMLSTMQQNPNPIAWAGFTLMGNPS